MDVGKGRELGAASFAYMDVGKGRELGAASFAYMDVGKRREHMYRKYGIRAMHSAIAEDAEALPINEPFYYGSLNFILQIYILHNYLTITDICA